MLAVAVVAAAAAVRNELLLLLLLWLLDGCWMDVSRRRRVRMRGCQQLCHNLTTSHRLCVISGMLVVVMVIGVR